MSNQQNGSKIAGVEASQGWQLSPSNIQKESLQDEIPEKEKKSIWSQYNYQHAYPISDNYQTAVLQALEAIIQLSY